MRKMIIMAAMLFSTVSHADCVKDQVDYYKQLGITVTVTDLDQIRISCAGEAFFNSLSSEDKKEFFDGLKSISKELREDANEIGKRYKSSTNKNDNRNSTSQDQKQLDKFLKKYNLN